MLSRIYEYSRKSPETAALSSVWEIFCAAEKKPCAEAHGGGGRIFSYRLIIFVQPSASQSVR